MKLWMKRTAFIGHVFHRHHNAPIHISFRCSSSQGQHSQDDELSREKLLAEKLYTKTTGPQSQKIMMLGSQFTFDSNHLKLFIFTVLLMYISLVSIYQFYQTSSQPTWYHLPFWMVDESDAGRWMLLQIGFGQQFIDSVYDDFEKRRAGDTLLSFSVHLDEKYPRLFEGNEYTHDQAMRTAAYAVRNCSQKQLLKIFTVGSQRGSPKSRVDNFIRNVVKLFPELTSSLDKITL
ncbi:hypothetical protein XU18_2520 [Perkinsela sp. CCAP 1560/4]|nr:hypothetical protein XU18_4039 [Perkinsela sp. CCAP 1560/4]KNH06619.1 hypothetical protein XU18_2520 [Perkinsela sp. CCAP 1560/4]|eukprot:KNH04752.1 hypothetical protein XU18_4039 [Perkinsela sp. CCAP 1560/4]